MRKDYSIPVVLAVLFFFFFSSTEERRVAILNVDAGCSFPNFKKRFPVRCTERERHRKNAQENNNNI